MPTRELSSLVQPEPAEAYRVGPVERRHQQQHQADLRCIARHPRMIFARGRWADDRVDAL